MKLVQVVILILMVLGILAILFCARLLYSFSNEAFKAKTEVEGFHNKDDLNDTNFGCDPVSGTHCLIPNNLPMDKPRYAKVGGYIEKGSDNLVPSAGKYQFVKPELLYDGIWKEEVNQIDGFAKNNWRMIPEQQNSPFKEGVYGTNKLFDIKNEPIDGMKAPVDNCSEIIALKNERSVQLPLRGKCNFYPEPDMEDILGYRIA